MCRKNHFSFYNSTKYIHFFRNEVILNRINVLKRDNFICQYCSKKSNSMTIDHIIPKNKGGKDRWDNLVAACSKCNTKKGYNRN